MNALYAFDGVAVAVRRLGIAGVLFGGLATILLATSFGGCGRTEAPPAPVLKETPEFKDEIAKFFEIFRATIKEGTQEEFLNLFTADAVVQLGKLGRNWIGKPAVDDFRKLLMTSFKSFNLTLLDAPQIMVTGRRASGIFTIALDGVHPDGGREHWNADLFLMLRVDQGLWRIEHAAGNFYSFQVTAANPALPGYPRLPTPEINELLRLRAQAGATRNLGETPGPAGPQKVQMGAQTPPAPGPNPGGAVEPGAMQPGMPAGGPAPGMPPAGAPPPAR